MSVQSLMQVKRKKKQKERKSYRKWGWLRGQATSWQGREAPLTRNVESLDLGEVVHRGGLGLLTLLFRVKLQDLQHSLGILRLVLFRNTGGTQEVLPGDRHANEIAALWIKSHMNVMHKVGWASEVADQLRCRGGKGGLGVNSWGKKKSKRLPSASHQSRSTPHHHCCKPCSTLCRSWL